MLALFRGLWTDDDDDEIGNTKDESNTYHRLSPRERHHVVAELLRLEPEERRELLGDLGEHFLRQQMRRLIELAERHELYAVALQKGERERRAKVKNTHELTSF